MIVYETIVTEVWKRLTQIQGVNRTDRNPDTDPEATDCPYVALFELGEVTEGTQKRPGAKIYKKRMQIGVEAFVASSSAEAASRDLSNWLEKVKGALNSAISWPGGTSDLIEVEMTRVATLDAENHMKGRGVTYEIMYIENTGNY